ncbi:MAG TPA: anti-sigma factor [Dermatophilaceae bacterium]|nr:anti-sigma factor [Dermatophilaceae bacterium]
MSHPDEELLVDLALGSGAATSAEVRDHVDGCPVCAAAVQELRHTVALVSHAELPPTWNRPPDELWSRVEEAIVLESATAPGTGEEAPPTGEPATEDLAAEEPAATAPVTTLESRRAPGPGRRVMPWAAGMAAAGLAIGLLTGRALWSDTSPVPATIAQAQLDTLDTNQRRGQARVVQAGGSVDLTVATTAPFDARDGFIEVWLINKDGKRMVSVGVLRGSSPETFPITQTLIDQGYVIVDISREGFDNKPQHSGDSLARGTLRT